MIEVMGDLWTYEPQGRQPDIRVITTNGTIKRDGRGVMGAGCALEARQRYPGIDRTLGQAVHRLGNIVAHLHDGPPPIWSFPVKHEWHQPADIRLIEVSAQTLRAFADLEGWRTILLPRPGCGNGRLTWTQVQPVLRRILDDDRFLVITKG